MESPSELGWETENVDLVRVFHPSPYRWPQGWIVQKSKASRNRIEP